MRGFLEGENIDNHSYAIQEESDRSYALLTFTRFKTLKKAKAYAEQLEVGRKSDVWIAWKPWGDDRWLKGCIESGEKNFFIKIPIPPDYQYELYDRNVDLIGKFEDLESTKAVAELLNNRRLTNEYI